ncbi:adenosylcobinamide-phosphate synthase CbiB [Pseudomonas sp. Marseille-QA0892]
MSLALTTILAVLLDAVFGEPRRWHPLVIFGNWANRLERRFNGVSLPDEPGRGWRSHGVSAWCLAVLPPVLIVWLLSLLPGVGLLVDVICLYLAIGLRSLTEHALPVAQALRLGQLDEARRLVGRVVSRDTSALDEEGVARAATESVLENGSDAVFAALFWFLIGGAPGVVLYRLSNTLDAMWGYRTPRFERFGWAAARIDDLLNLVPARLVALTYSICGHFRTGIACWLRQGHRWDSPNAGPVMAAGAGALRVTLGGMAIYHGERHVRPELGQGSIPRARDIERAINLVWLGVGLWIALVVLGGV